MIVKYLDYDIDLSLCNYRDGIALIQLPDGWSLDISETNASSNELEIINLIKEDVAKRVPIPVDPVIVQEPVDEEKAALAEAVIFMSEEIEALKIEIQALKGGVKA